MPTYSSYQPEGWFDPNQWHQINTYVVMYTHTQNVWQPTSILNQDLKEVE